MTKEIIRYCTHCGNYALQEMVYEHKRGIRDRLDDEYSHLYCATDFVVVCKTCENLSIYSFEHIGAEADDELIDANIVWPKLLNYDPQILGLELTKTYQEALTVKLNSPIAFVMLIRRALEIVCQKQGVKEGSLHASIKKLTQQGKLPPFLSDLTLIIKMIGNSGAHDIECNISSLMVDTVDSFFSS